MSLGILFLLAALVCVPLAVRLGLGSILGYLAAGVALGPVGLGLVSDPQAILHASELGVVLMLFVIGLELEPQRLWGLRMAVFGGGTLQMLVCALALLPLGLLAGWSWQASVVAALALALSSTAIVVGLLQERRWMPLPLGQSSFAMLLFQDIAAIPLLALAAALGTGAVVDAASMGHDSHAWWGLPQWLWQVGAVAAVVLFGKFVAYPLMRFVARMQVRELFTAVALLMVLGVALLMEKVGLSMGLGAFLAGVLLASSEYRHALENDILPFKGLLLGLFFIAVGMSMQLGLVATAPLQVLGALILVVGLKALALWALAPRVGLKGQDRLRLAVLLSQVGEFAFVVLAAAKSAHTLPAAEADLLTLVAALSMLTTPLLLKAQDRFMREGDASRPTDTMHDEHPQVILAGFGRFGQTVGRVLSASGVRTTVIDHNADTVDAARRFGFKVYFGDATQPDLLHAAGIEHAKVLVLAIDDAQQCLRVVHEVQHSHPQVRIVARARDALNAMELLDAGVQHVERELFEGSLRCARATLTSLGQAPYPSRLAADNFRRYSERFLHQSRHARHDETDLIARVRQAREQFEAEMQADREQRPHSASGWHGSSPETKA
jgi:glutathione-regulated potassium-efflux system ancillary protein KefC